jgi:hypothetical protein
MKKLLLAYLKIYKFDSRNIRESVLLREFRLISIGLKRYGNKTRKKILEQLNHVSLQNELILTHLLRIVEIDYLKNATLALEVLQKNSTKNPGFSEKIKLAKEIYKERMRRYENKSQFYTDFKVSLAGSKSLDKSKMKRLEKVRQQLKKPMR